MRASKRSSTKRNPPGKPTPDYPLQGSRLDIPMEEVLSYSEEQRAKYISRFLTGLRKEIEADTMALKKRVPFAKEMRDLRKLLYSPADQYLYTDDKTRNRYVLGRGAPGGTHTFWSRTQMWKMATANGNLRKDILEKSQNLISQLDRLFDGKNRKLNSMRTSDRTAVRNALLYMQFDKNSGTAFPPFHAKFFADRYLPADGEGIVVDPCAGWGGRLLGTLCVQRAGHVRYYGVDPEKGNKPAYEGLSRRINVWLKKEVYGKRTARIFYQPFEDWINTRTAERLRGRVDLVITSPPYFSTEEYNPSDKKQSSNRYHDYQEWREGFYRTLFEGAYDLLKPNGVFVLNVANVPRARRLEDDGVKLALETGFERDGFFKMAISVSPRLKNQKRRKKLVTIDGSVFRYEPIFVFRKCE